MSIQVTCGKCQGVVEAPDAMAGSDALCPYCRSVVKVETPAAPPPGSSPAKGHEEMVFRRDAVPENNLPFTGGNRSSSPASGPKLASMSLDGEDGKTPANEVESKRANSAADATGAVDASVPRPAGAARDDGPVGLVLGGRDRNRGRRSRLATLMKSFFRGGNPTDVSILLTGIVAAILTVLLYVFIIHPVRTSYIGALFAERGWVPYATCYFAVWAAVILVVKMWKLAAQQTALTYDLLPVDANAKIDPANVAVIQHHIRKLPLDPRKSFLINRVLLALDHFRSRKSVPEVGDLLNSQAEIDGAMVESSYSMVKVFVWAIPILGFIGTVIGISDAVSGFTLTIEVAQELDSIKTALGQVTGGLAVAFDTTLIALVLSLIIAFPMNSLQKAEDDLLSEIDQYCNENLLRRLHVPQTDGSPEKAVVQAMSAALGEWQKRMENFETALFEKVMDNVEEMKERAGADQAATR